MSKEYVKCKSEQTLPGYCPLKSEIELNGTYEEYFADKFGLCIGQIKEDGKKDSWLAQDDKNGNTEIFDRLLKDLRLVKKRVDLRNRKTMESYSATRYYVPYIVQNHSSSKPTVTGENISFAINVAYELEYELLFVTYDGLTRYMTFSFKTEGSGALSLWDIIQNLEETFEEFFEKEQFGFGYGEFGEKTVRFYDDLGEWYDVSIDERNGLLDMLSSVRIIGLKSEIIPRAL